MLDSCNTPNLTNKDYNLPLIWQKCTNLRSLKQIHASMVVKGFTLDKTFLTQLLLRTAWCTFGPTTHYAHKVFGQIPKPDTFMWNAMIRTSTHGPDPLQAVAFYAEMAARDVRPDAVTFPPLIRACNILLWIGTGSAIQGKVWILGFGSDKFIKTSLLSLHANCGDLRISHDLFHDGAMEDVVAWRGALKAARKLFDEMPDKSLAFWKVLISRYATGGDMIRARKLFYEMPKRSLGSSNGMISRYAERGDMMSARKLFDEMTERNVFTWNTMISGYVLGGMNQKALDLFKEMMRIGECPNKVTLCRVLSSCAKLGDLETGKKIHEKILEMNSGEISTFLGTALVDMYAKCGSIVKALQVFWSIKDKDVISWSSAIYGLAFHGHAEESIDLFQEMQRTKLCPNAVTFLCVLKACSHAGKVEEGFKFFDLMRIKYNIEPEISHFGCMVDMLGRAGHLKEAFDFIASMKMTPSAPIWRSLLGSCKVYGDVKLAKRANEELLKMRSNKSSDYMLMANVYTWQGNQDEAERQRELMKDSGVRKDAGSCTLA
ncbi:hypothetical protein PIB30_037289 [Stylosanthes scabra]|uniref:Pentatricopeptide repeat-containing protein n=1 Tax=Stylosanthes scabra TaxID=79078 RepID=A0ABU6WDS9_9FABA|nr:hypothetical protein [Stylosanthes scabra]